MLSYNMRSHKRRIKVYKNDENTQSRLAQIERMAEACWTKFAASLPKDTINLEKN